MHVQRVAVPLVSIADGSGTGFSVPLTGRLVDLQYVKHGTTPYDNTVDFTITAENSGRALWSESNVTASKIIAPRQPTHDTAAVASLYAAGGEPVEDHICLAEERVKIVIAQAGDTKTGTFYITVA